MTTQKTRLISLPMATQIREYRTGSLTDQQIQTLAELAKTPGIQFHTHLDAILKDGRPSRWTCLISIGGKLSPVVIETDGRRSR
jgi:hypothetical protein